MLYVIFGTDRPGAAEKRAAARPAHLERIKALRREGRMELVGPTLETDAPSMEGGVSGSLIVADFPSLLAAEAWADADPYCTAGVYAEVQVRPFLSVNPQ